MKELFKKASDKAKSIYLFWLAINLSIFLYQGSFLGWRDWNTNIIFKYDPNWFPFELEAQYYEYTGSYDLTEFLFYCLVPPLLYFSKKLWPKKEKNKEVEKKKESDEFEEDEL